MKTDFDVATGLKIQRVKHKLKNSDVAKILNISEGHYRNFERNTRNLAIDYAVKLADFYGISVDELIYRRKAEK